MSIIDSIIGNRKLENNKVEYRVRWKSKLLFDSWQSLECLTEFGELINDYEMRNPEVLKILDRRTQNREQNSNPEYLVMFKVNGHGSCNG